MEEKVPTIHLFQESSINIIHCLSQGAAYLRCFRSQLKEYRGSCRSINFYYKSPLEHKSLKKVQK